MAYNVKTDHSLAVDSPDHQQPHGAHFGGTYSPLFVAEVERLVGKNARVLCFGCSGGRLVEEFVKAGHEAVGIEGSDYHVQNQSGSWAALHNERLFTCDAGFPFQVAKNGRKATFDVITAWDVLEHIPEDRIDTALQNVEQHLAKGGLFFATICLRPSVIGDAVYHQTVKPKAWWREKLAEHFDYAGVDLMRRDAWHAMVCWHGSNRKAKEPGPGCVNWATWYIGRSRK